MQCSGKNNCGGGNNGNDDNDDDDNDDDDDDDADDADDDDDNGPTMKSLAVDYGRLGCSNCPPLKG